MKKCPVCGKELEFYQVWLRIDKDTALCSPKCSKKYKEQKKEKESKITEKVKEEKMDNKEQKNTIRRNNAMKWEYKVIELKKETLRESKSAEFQLNELGSEGWEVVGIAPTRSLAYGGDKLGKWVFVLKRKI